MSDSLWPHGLQHTRLPCPSPTPGAYINACPSSRWCHPTILSSVIPFSSCLQSFPASGSFPMLRCQIICQNMTKKHIVSSYVLHLLFLYRIHPLVCFLIPKNWLENPSLKSIHLIIFWSVNQLLLFSKGSFLLTWSAKVSKKLFLYTLKSHL